MSEVYVLDKHNNYIPSMTKEEIIAAIQTAAAGGSLEGFNNCAVVTQIKELNRNAAFSVWVGTQAEYNALAEKAKNVLYLISDDLMAEELPNKVENLFTILNEYDLIIQQQKNTLKEHTEKLMDCEKSIEAQGEMVTAHEEQLKGIAKVGYTELFSGLLGNFTAVNGVTISEAYDEFDFLIFEFYERGGNDEGKYYARAVLPTLGLAGGNIFYGLQLNFEEATRTAKVQFKSENKNKIFFKSSDAAYMLLNKIYGYIRKAGV